MNILLRSRKPLLLSMLLAGGALSLGISSAPAAFAATPPSAHTLGLNGNSRVSKASTSATVRLTVRISTASGVPLGSVTNSFNHQTCHSTSCSYLIPRQHTIHLTETPRYPSAWSFQQWTVNGQGWGTNGSIGFTVVGKSLNSVVATALYSRRATVYSQLAGQWLGPEIGDTGQCGSAYGEFTLSQNQAITYTQNTQNCGGFTSWGNYWIQGTTLYWHDIGASCAPGCITGWTVTESFRFITANAFQICDTRCYIYHRQ